MVNSEYLLYQWIHSEKFIFFSSYKPCPDNSEYNKRRISEIGQTVLKLCSNNNFLIDFYICYIQMMFAQFLHFTTSDRVLFNTIKYHVWFFGLVNSSTSYIIFLFRQFLNIKNFYTDFNDRELSVLSYSSSNYNGYLCVRTCPIIRTVHIQFVSILYYRKKIRYFLFVIFHQRE